MRALLYAAVTAASLIGSGMAHSQPAPTPGNASLPAATPIWFARVNGTEISAAAFDLAAKEAFRSKFYHGSPPEDEINLMLRGVGDRIIDQVLLQRELDIKKIKPDPEEVKGELDKLEQRYGNSPAWKEQREKTLPELRSHFESKSRLNVLERAIRSVSASPEEVRRFYDKNPALFTEPEKNRVSLILFRVDPSSPSREWEKALKQAEQTKAEILAGADFAQLAKTHSQDQSASQGGDLGYLHQGMLGPAIEEELAKAKLSEVGGPIRTLEGYVVYRLDGRITAKLRDFSAVEPRAKELFLRQKGDETWLKYLDSLRVGAKIEINPAFEKVMQAIPASPQARP